MNMRIKTAVILLLLSLQYMVFFIIWTMSVPHYNKNAKAPRHNVRVKYPYKPSKKRRWKELTPSNDSILNQICANWANELEWSTETSPLINLDKSRFIYPAIVNGPSNELIGFQDALFVAVKTNRTIVVPMFKPHFQDKDRGNHQYIPASMRLDLKRISQLAPLVTIVTLQSKCNKHFDVGFQTKSVSCGFEKFVRKTSNMTLDSPYFWLLYGGGYENMRFRGNKTCEVSNFPVRHIPPVAMNPEYVTERYSSSLPCALVINTYKSLRRPPTNHDEKLIERARKHPSSLVPGDLKNYTSETLFKLIEIFTQRPKYVRDIARAFVHDVIRNKQYIALHWRYNDEWKISYCFPDRTKLRFCHKLNAVDAGKLAASVFLLTKDLVEMLNFKVSGTDCNSRYIANAYLATAVSEHEEVKSYSKNTEFRNAVISEALEEEGRFVDAANFPSQTCWKIRLLTKIDLLHYLESKYPRLKCPVIWRDTHELLSLIENEICKISMVFAYSPSSSWSLVALQPRTKKFEYAHNIPIWDVLSRVDELFNKSSQERNDSNPHRVIDGNFPG